jgi:broad specificity phosphatase PhoE
MRRHSSRDSWLRDVAVRRDLPHRVLIVAHGGSINADSSGVVIAGRFDGCAAKRPI